MKDSVREFRSRQVFATGQVAKICHVAPRTVTKWFDLGKLRGYRIPGSQDRRFPRESLVRFLRLNNMTSALAQLGDGIPLVLAAGLAESFHAPLADLLSGVARVQFVSSLFDVGLFLSTIPDVVILDSSLGTGDVLRITEQLRADLVPVVALLPEDGQAADCGKGVRLLRHPVAPEAVAAAIRDQLGDD